MFRFFLCKEAKEGPINYFCETGQQKLNPALLLRLSELLIMTWAIHQHAEGKFMHYTNDSETVFF